MLFCFLRINAFQEFLKRWDSHQVFWALKWFLTNCAVLFKTNPYYCDSLFLLHEETFCSILKISSLLLWRIYEHLMNHLINLTYIQERCVVILNALLTDRWLYIKEAFSLNFCSSIWYKLNNYAFKRFFGVRKLSVLDIEFYMNNLIFETMTIKMTQNISKLLRKLQVAIFFKRLMKDGLCFRSNHITWMILDIALWCTCSRNRLSEEQDEWIRNLRIMKVALQKPFSCCHTHAWQEKKK